MKELIANTRIVEDTLAFVLLSIAIVLLLRAAIRLKNNPDRIIPIALALGLIPLYVWKSMGSFRRIFLDKAANPELYKTLHDVGEVFESLSGLILAISYAVILLSLRKRASNSHEIPKVVTSE